MTTILADSALGLMVADSNCVEGDRVWSIRKVIRSRGALVACAGDVSEGNAFVDWWKSGSSAPPDFSFAESSALVLDDSGLYLFDASMLGLTKVPSGRESIGSGGVAAICAYEALGWTDPTRAVRIACRHDANSRTPVRTYRLKGSA